MPPDFQHLHDYLRRSGHARVVRHRRGRRDSHNVLSWIMFVVATARYCECFSFAGRIQFCRRCHSAQKVLRLVVRNKPFVDG